MGSAHTDHEARKRLRKKMEARGASAAEVAAAVEAKRIEQGRARGEVTASRKGLDVGTPEERLAGNTPPPQSPQRDRVIRRDGRRCRYCGRPVIEGAARPCDRLTIDHVTPTSRGGSNWASNRVVASESCNHQKADRTLEEWGRPLLPPRGQLAPQVAAERAA